MQGNETKCQGFILVKCVRKEKLRQCLLRRHSCRLDRDHVIASRTAAGLIFGSMRDISSMVRC